MSAITPDQPSRPTGVGADDRPTGRARPAPAAAKPRTPGTKRGRAPLVVAAGVAAGWAVLTSYLPVAAVLGLAQLSEDAASVGGALRAGLAGWLLGHGVPLVTSAGQLGLAPLALTVVVVWRLTRAGVHATRARGARGSRQLRPALVVAGAVGLWYALLGVLAALMVGAGSLDASPLRSGFTLGFVAVPAALAGALRTTGLPDGPLRRVPPAVREGVHAGVVAGLLLVGAGAGVAGLAIATGGGDAADMIGAYRTGVAGQAGITLVSLAYAPNAAMWSASYLLGPGFAVGTDTAVRTSEVSVGALPAVPLLAGLPRGPLDGIGTLLLAVPILVGMAAGYLLARRLWRIHADPRAPLPWAPLLASAAVAGPVAGLLVGFGAAVSGGSLGDGRLAELGPVAWQVATATTAVATVGVLLGAAATRMFVRPSGRP